MFSERLKLARKRSGLSLRALSSNMGETVSAQAIGKYERGEMMPSSSVAIALANALDVTTTYLLSPTVVSLESVEFRKSASTKARERAMVEAAVLDHVDRYLQVEELLDIASSVWEVPDGAPYHAESVEGGELTAARLRRTWLDFAQFKRRRRGNLRVGGIERQGVPACRGQRPTVRNPPTPATGGVAPGRWRPRRLATACRTRPLCVG